MYTYEDVYREARTLLRGRRIDWDALGWRIEGVLHRKRRLPYTARDAALVAIEALDGRDRRLSHGTGATDWRDRYPGRVVDF